MKEFLSALLAVLLLISVLVACDSHKDVDDAGSGSVSSENKEKDTTTEARQRRTRTSPAAIS